MALQKPCVSYGDSHYFRKVPSDSHKIFRRRFFASARRPLYPFLLMCTFPVETAHIGLRLPPQLRSNRNHQFRIGILTTFDEDVTFPIGSVTPRFRGESLVRLSFSLPDPH